MIQHPSDSAQKSHLPSPALTDATNRKGKPAVAKDRKKMPNGKKKVCLDLTMVRWCEDARKVSCCVNSLTANWVWD